MRRQKAKLMLLRASAIDFRLPFTTSGVVCKSAVSIQQTAFQFPRRELSYDRKLHWYSSANMTMISGNMREIVP